MECVGFGIVLIVLLVMGYIGLRGDSSRGYAARALRVVADRFGGRFEDRGWFGQSRVVFVNDGICVVEFVQVDGRTSIEIRIATPPLPAQGKVVALNIPGAAVPARPGYAYYTRFRDGDRCEYVLFHQQTTDGYQLLGDGVRQQIGVLRQTPVSSKIEIDFLPGGMVVRKVWPTIVADNAVRIVHQVLALRDQLTLIMSGDIEFVTGQAKLPQDTEVVCRVCGDPVSQNVVYCARCQTPHHYDCWTYGHGCSVYGCGGRECVKEASRQIE